MEIFSSIPRWVRVSGLVLALGLSTEVLYEAYLGWSAIRARNRKAMARAAAASGDDGTVFAVYFANKRSLSLQQEVSMSSFTAEHVRRIVTFIDRAQASINLAMYICTVESIGDALLRALNRGVKVRVIGCSSMAYSTGSQMTRLVHGGIPVRFPSKDGAYLMHHKFCLIDTEWMCARCFHEETERLDGYCCAARFGSRSGGPASVGIDSAASVGAVSAVNVSPLGNGGNKVQCSVNGPLEVCARCPAGKNGQKKKKKQMQKIKESVSSENGEILEPIPEGGLLVTGSMNWTMQALSGNFDNIIVTSAPDLIAPFQLEYQRLWKQFGALPALITKDDALPDRPPAREGASGAAAERSRGSGGGGKRS